MNVTEQQELAAAAERVRKAALTACSMWRSYVEADPDDVRALCDIATLVASGVAPEQISLRKHSWRIIGAEDSTAHPAAHE